jgi:hypothetical protein
MRLNLKKQRGKPQGSPRLYSKKDFVFWLSIYPCLCDSVVRFYLKNPVLIIIKVERPPYSRLN